ncbi:hypothetical protein BpHYR1_005377 [Brachionus plicatilis]|uniref:Uncharacterized protein n=1 Tax=Brachionus plicatilis TaxID=10195 RepID=A0A3M7RGK4_BRAPC|nr:hypothetical protein BpHYR1_005377 [Brachionus plicatilis]
MSDYKFTQSKFKVKKKFLSVLFDATFLTISVIVFSLFDFFVKDKIRSLFETEAVGKLKISAEFWFDLIILKLPSCRIHIDFFSFR